MDSITGEPTPEGPHPEAPGREAALPPYSFVPGGPWPHPTASPRGHSAGRPSEPVAPIAAGRWDESAPFRRGIDLFNAGYYWEAHEAWEGLWHAHGRRGPTADLLKALIKLAAAGVKVRERQPHGVVTHAGRAAALFRSARDGGGPRQLGLDLDEAAAVARRIAEHPPADPTRPADPVARVFSFRIEPREDLGACFPAEGLDPTDRGATDAINPGGTETTCRR